MLIHTIQIYIFHFYCASIYVCIFILLESYFNLIYFVPFYLFLVPLLHCVRFDYTLSWLVVAICFPIGCPSAFFLSRILSFQVVAADFIVDAHLLLSLSKKDSDLLMGLAIYGIFMVFLRSFFFQLIYTNFNLFSLNMFF